MGLMERFGERQAIKLIKHYTGQDITPKFIAAKIRIHDAFCPSEGISRNTSKSLFPC